LPPLGRSHPRGPLLGDAEGPIEEALGQVHAPTLPDILRERPEPPRDHAGLAPRLEPSVARLVRRIPVRQILPGRAGAQDPEHPVPAGPRVRPGTPTASVSMGGAGDSADPGPPTAGPLASWRTAVSLL